MRKLCTMVFVVAAWVVVAIPVLADHMNPDDMQVLVDLYQSTNGTEWVHSDNWLNPTDHNWYGVRLDSQGRVIWLGLEDNHLRGQLPTSLGNLQQLISLYLGNNDLSGAIPSSLGNLSQLSTLDLSYNQLSGTIPESLSNLTELTILDLSDNQLSGAIPSKLMLRYGFCPDLRNNRLAEGEFRWCANSVQGNPVWLKFQEEEKVREAEERVRAAPFDKFEFLLPLQLGLIGGYLLIMLLLEGTRG